MAMNRRRLKKLMAQVEHQKSRDTVTLNNALINMRSHYDTTMGLSVPELNVQILKRYMLMGFSQKTEYDAIESVKRISAFPYSMSPSRYPSEGGGGVTIEYAPGKFRSIRIQKVSDGLPF